MKKLILYTCGGLSNKMFPLSSCLEYSKISNRELFIYWPIDNRCLANFNDLYNDKINIVNEPFLSSLADNETEYHAEYLDGVTNDFNLYNRTFLYEKYKNNKVIIDNINYNTVVKNLVIMTNTFLKNINITISKQNLRNMKFKKDVVDKADHYTKKFNLNKNVIGCHIRGTDLKLHNPLNYNKEIQDILNKNKQQLFFISSDDKEIEYNVKNKFKENIIIRPNKHYVEKNIKTESWLFKQNNTLTTVEMLKDSLIDLILLSKTNFIIKSNISTFSTYAEILGEKHD